MGKMGEGYGSEYHLRYYRMHDPTALDEAIRGKVGLQNKELNWLYPSNETPKEPEGLRFLNDSRVLGEWKSFWPQRGTQPSWDGVAYVLDGRQNEWLLLEAKANHPEFCSRPSESSGKSRLRITAALNETKKYLGVHRDFHWLGTYYQYANRLALLYFLSVRCEVQARLVLVYFCGDHFKDDRYCPADEPEWRKLIQACHLTLGLPQKHKLSDRIHELFLPTHGTLRKEISGLV